MSNRTCSINGCNRSVSAITLCRKHYDAQREDPPRDRDRNPRKCSIVGCSSGHSARGYCQAHYHQWRAKNGKPCSIEDCGKKVTARGWCSTHYSRWRKHGDPLAGDSANRQCRYCGNDLPQGSRAGTVFCGYDCRKDHNTQFRVDSNAEIRASITRACRQCGTDFTPQKSVRASFCSKQCSRNYYRHKTTKTCSEPGCDRKFLARGMCHMHYRRWARSEGIEVAQPWNERKKANYLRRKALKLQLPADDIRPIDVFERDGWICGICDEQVSESIPWPDPLSPSLDHVIPLSKGGSHTFDNVQLAHLFCNISKGDSLQVDAMSA